MREIPITGVRLGVGSHRSAREGFCAMEYLALVLGYEWTAIPNCTDYTVAVCVQGINDSLDDDRRQGILDRLQRISEARPMADFHKRVEGRLALHTWIAKKLLRHLTPDLRQPAEAAIDAIVANAEAGSPLYDVASLSRRLLNNLLGMLGDGADSDVENALRIMFDTMSGDPFDAAELIAMDGDEGLRFLDDLLDMHEKLRVEAGDMCNADEEDAA